MEQQLRHKIEVDIGREIRTRGDCELLSSIIAQRTGKLISYNTLRRFFGIDANRVKTRLSTLDVLSQFLSYESYQHFIEHIPEDRIRSFNLRLAEAISVHTPQELAHLTLSLSPIRPQFIESIIQVCRNYLILKQIDRLLQFSEIAGLDSTHFSYDEKLYIGNQIGILFRTANLPKSKLNKLNRSHFFNENLFEIFVDYSSLKKYYGDFTFSKPQSGSQVYFKKALRILINFVQNRTLPEFLEIDPIPSEFHPILLGRWASLPLYFPGRIASTYFSKFDNHYSLGFFYEPMVASILTSNYQLHPQIKSAIKQYLKQLHVFEMYYYHVYNLFEATYEYKQGNQVAAIIHMDRVDPSQFRLSYKPLLSLFYFTLKWKLLAAEEVRDAAYNLSDSLDYERYNREFVDSY